MLRNLTILAFLAAVALAQDEASVRKAARIVASAKKHEKTAKELWKKYVFEEEMADAEIHDLINRYEKAIDLYQKALEEYENAGINAAILKLTRRVTQARFFLMQLATQRRIKKEKEEERKKAREKPEPDQPPEEPEQPRPPDERDPPNRSEDAEEPESQPDPPRRTQLLTKSLPEMEEPPAQRRRGIQSARNFLMNYYFAPRKFTSMVVRCSRCNGAGSILTGRVTKKRRAERVPCPSCGKTGYHLNKHNARKGHWLIHSPLYRSDKDKADQWRAVIASWDKDPREIPEFLKSVKIERVDYHGLWVELTWTEKGKTPTSGRFQRKVTRKMIRAGRRWFFYDETLDREFFTGSTD